MVTSVELLDVLDNWSELLVAKNLHPIISCFLGEIYLDIFLANITHSDNKTVTCLWQGWLGR